LRQRIARQLGIGYAPPGGRALLEHLADNGFSIQEAITAGVATDPDEPGRASRDFYRGRITFPIRSTNGRIQSFGGRAIGGSDKDGPKYLNGRETPLFDKGRTLYGLDLTRPAIAKQGRAIVLEGYIDVATCMQAGIENVVAPLGTALTVEHLHALWRVAPAIVYVSDGDEAGIRAGNRLLETALPWVSGDRRLTFGVLPAGVDPDDLVRNSGAAAFTGILRNPQSLVDRLWQALRAETPGEGPEDRAKLETELRERLAVVADPAMRKAYSDELLRRARRLGQARPALGRSNLERRIAPAIPAREAALVLGALTHPEYLDQELERVAELPFQAPLCAALRDLLLRTMAQGQLVRQDDVARDVAVLRQALPQPEPRFVTSADLEGFRDALDLHGTQRARQSMRANFRPSA
jgi:DNA primase